MQQQPMLLQSNALINIAYYHIEAFHLVCTHTDPLELVGVDFQSLDCLEERIFDAFRRSKFVDHMIRSN